MAPEQLLRGQSSVQSDLYSLGLILYEMFSGEPVHQATSLRDLRQFHSDSLAAFVFLSNLFAWACVCRHVAHPGEYVQLLMGVATSLMIAGLIWVFYLAIEPFARREWPELLVGWRRLLD